MLKVWIMKMMRMSRATVERLKDLSATLPVVSGKRRRFRVIIPDASKADLKLNTNDFPSRTDAYQLIRRITWKEDNEGVYEYVYDRPD
ncbi:MAG: hypothetical protein ACLR2D_07985 [Anaerobutyricum hallii]